MVRSDYIDIFKAIFFILLLVQWVIVITELWRSEQAEVAIPDTNMNTRATETLLTLFTTLKSTSDRYYIHKNTLKNWSQMRPRLDPILFKTRGEDFLLLLHARWNCWTVLDTPKVNKYGTPYLKDMFASAREHSNATFYGYANGDILYTTALTTTLSYIRELLPVLGHVLVIGRRRNYKMADHRGSLYDTEQVAEVAGVAGRDGGTVAIDYFIVSHLGFPWVYVPDIVVGRPGYDNFLVRVALKRNVSVVDVTRTVTALHQTGIDGDHAGFSNADVKHNYNQIGKHYKYHDGRTDKANYETRLNSLNQVEVWARPRPAGGTKWRKIQPPPNRDN